MDIVTAIFESGGAKPHSWKDAPIGAAITGEVLNIRARQLKAYKSEALETWDDGSPKLTPILTLQTDLGDGEEDDGTRDLYLRSGQHTAFKTALHAEFTKGKPTTALLVGRSVTMTLVDIVETDSGDPRKVYECRIGPKVKAAKRASS